MADEKKKAKRVITPVFAAMFAWLNTPNTKYDADGVYQVSGKFDPKIPGHRSFLKTLADIHKANVEESRKTFKATKKQPEMKVTPPMHEEDDGTYRVNFKESAFLVPKTGPKAGQKIDLKPAIVDAKGQPTDIEVWTGSDIKVAVDVAPFYNGSLGAGLSLRLKGVQVITLRTRGSRDGASLGFGVEEGFSADDSGTPNFNDEPNTGTDTSDDLLSDDVGNDTPVDDGGSITPTTPAAAPSYDF